LKKFIIQSPFILQTLCAMHFVDANAIPLLSCIE